MRYVAVVLAGERDGINAIGHAAGVPCKALAPVGDRPMLARVLQTLKKAPQVANCLVIGSPADRACVAGLLEEVDGFARWCDGAESPARSATVGLAGIPPEQPVLLTTADHPLLSREIIDYVCRQGEMSDADIVVSVARHAEVMAAIPDARCTAYRFADDAYCGTNLFVLKTPKGRRMVEIWQDVEQSRKKPWAVVRLIGIGSVAQYLLRRLSLRVALERMSSRFGVTVTASVLPFPRAALDVDTIEDWRLVCQLAESTDS